MFMGNYKYILDSTSNEIEYKIIEDVNISSPDQIFSYPGVT